VKRQFSKLPALATITAILLSCHNLCAASCEERCFKSYLACATARASGCSVNGRPLGTPALKLVKAVTLPEASSLFDSSVKTSSVEECEELIKPCDEIEISCHINCVPTADQEPPRAVHEDVEMDFTASPEPQAAAPVIPPGRKTGSLRIFSDHPQVRVYLNEQEIPVKPGGGDVESLITPEIAVGKYWARLTATEGDWQWEGEVDVEEGGANQIKGELVNLPKIRGGQEEALKKYKNKIWREIKKLESDKNFNSAISAYESFVEVFHRYKAQCKRAEKKLEKLKNKYEEILLEEILEMSDANKLQRLCSQYLTDYAEGEYLDRVRPIADEVRSLRRQIYERAGLKDWFKQGCSESPTGRGGAMCFFHGGSFTMGYND
jgi:hypothetical protein